ncbi:heterokaryon incompatibility protein [Apiospora kogelbergensis]|uniref:heterokaryon incompatibility protein n=1 Tax=Apiospora kogelbergensis TaxID=1337665 RepID=UPI003131AF09
MEALADSEFRHLILLPGNRNDPLCCDLRTNTFEIEVAGKPLTITKSLEIILLRLRSSSHSRALWVDQMCIDQTNETEKSAQVQKMRSIYSNCTRALVWLGEIDDQIRREEAENAFTFLEYVAANFVNTSEGLRRPIPQRPKFMESMESFKAAMRALNTIGVNQCSWWHRVWTVQEAILPSDLIFVWGPFSLSWDAICPAISNKGSIEALNFMTQEEYTTAIGIGGVHRLLTHLAWVKCAKKGLTPMRSSILWRNRAATDPRDSVYALTGLHTANTLPRSSKCDYSLDMNQVFVNFTLDLIYSGKHAKSGDLCPLILDPWQEDTEGTPALPRWTVDMRSSPAYDTNPWRSYRHYRFYKANKGLPITDRPEYTGESLRVPGVLVDAVEVLGDGYVCRGDNASLFPSPRETIISWWKLYSHKKNQHLPFDLSDIPPTSCGVYGEFCSLLLGDLLYFSKIERWLRTNIEEMRKVVCYLRTGEGDLTREQLGLQLKNRRFFITREGLIGLGHLETTPGDEVWVLNHGRVPFTLRARGSPTTPSEKKGEDYIFVGHCYVQGIMHGLAADGERDVTDLEQRILCLY